MKAPSRREWIWLSGVLVLATLGCGRREAPSPAERYGARSLPPAPTADYPSRAAPVSVRERDPKTLFADHYEPPAVDVKPSLPAYTLPLETAAVQNWEEGTRAANLSRAGRKRLEAQGFVVSGMDLGEGIEDAYQTVERRGLPLFVTADSLLHLYHVQFDKILKDLEQGQFFRDVISLSRGLLQGSQQQYRELSGEGKEAARRNVAFLSVGLRLLGAEDAVPGEVKREVDAELAAIQAHAGFSRSELFEYKEDYSQYVPRGHYTHTEELARYFRALMWYGRMTFLLRGRSDRGAVPDEVARRQTLQALLLTQLLYGSGRKAQERAALWSRLYAVTAFYVGLADDLTPHEYHQAIREIYGKEVSEGDLPDESRLSALREHLCKMRPPTIYSGTARLIAAPGQLEEVLVATQGLRLVGQRATPDGYLMQRLIYPAVTAWTGSGPEPFTLTDIIGFGPGRGFARGLDVFAALGSERALELLQEAGDTEYEQYDEQLARLRQELAGLSEKEWNRTLYGSWLYTLQALVEPRGEGWPTFMQSDAWTDKQLHSALASWAELKHDTILYAKQPAGAMGGGAPPGEPVRGYIEPVPHFYARLLALTEMTRTGLAEMEALIPPAGERLKALAETLRRLLDLAGRELRNEALDEEDYSFIDHFGEQIAATTLGVEVAESGTPMVADVLTDPNSEKVVEEGVGRLNLLLVVYRLPDGRLILGGGPVLSYYEFKQPMAERLTDEVWKDWLRQGRVPRRPAWTRRFVVE